MPKPVLDPIDQSCGEGAMHRNSVNVNSFNKKFFILFHHLIKSIANAPGNLDIQLQYCDILIQNIEDYFHLCLDNI